MSDVEVCGCDEALSLRAALDAATRELALRDAALEQLEAEKRLAIGALMHACEAAIDELRERLRDALAGAPSPAVKP